MAIFTDPNEYVLACVSRYPSLYADNTVDGVKVRVFDQLFNVIGNGIRDHDELLAHLRVFEFDRERALRFCQGEKAYYGYTKTRKIGIRDVGFPDGDSITVAESERVNHPEIVLWQDCGRYEWNPYPNFEKKYSTVWQTNFSELGPDWADAVVWFYTRCNEWFDHNESKYHYAYPCNKPGKSQQLLDNMIVARNRYESDEAFALAYGGGEFNGDMDLFLKARWQKNLADIREYIQETIDEFTC